MATDVNRRWLRSVSSLMASFPRLCNADAKLDDLRRDNSSSLSIRVDYGIFVIRDVAAVCFTDLVFHYDIPELCTRCRDIPELWGIIGFH